jgi:DnaJ-class molecular chaperone
MSRRSAYDVLGVDRSAGAAEIRRAYKILVRTAHPDHAGGGAEAHERFLEIKAAYEILIDPGARSAYDLAPDGVLEVRLALELRAEQLRRRKRRLRRLYES